GTITSDAVFNIGAGVAPGGLFGIGTLNVEGDYVQSGGGALLINTRSRRRSLSSDLLRLLGADPAKYPLGWPN
ncbi:MAG: hypothetical protein AAGI06_18220, partial [Pseudomonadota bacterium]